MNSVLLGFIPHDRSAHNSSGDRLSRLDITFYRHINLGINVMMKHSEPNRDLL
jgi:hypothetical protein